MKNLHPLALSILNTSESLDEFWSRPSTRETYYGPARLQHFTRLVEEFHHRLESASSLLDVGCGPGKLAQAVHREFPDLAVTGVDYAASAIEWAQRENPWASFEVGDVTQGLPYRDQSFGLVFCVQSLEHMHAWRPAVREMLRVARHSVVITVPDGESDTFPAHVNHWTVDQAWQDFRPYGIEGIWKVTSHIPVLYITLSGE